jgi:hypothetical protein
MTTTAVLVHSSSRKADNALRVARVAAAGRVAAERVAEQARKAARYAAAVDTALAWVEDVRADGAVSVGFKICDDDGKHRFRTTLADAAGVLAHHAGEDVEAWGITASGEYVANVW